MVHVGTVQTTSSQGKGEEEEVEGGEDHVTDSEISNTHRHCFVPVFEVDESKRKRFLVVVADQELRR
jgi:hypothetical protein